MERVMILRWTVPSLVCFLVLGNTGISSGERHPRTVIFTRSLEDEQTLNYRSKRDASSLKSNFTSCKTSPSAEDHTVLEGNTHETGFHGDDGSSFTLTWVGDGTGVILVLSTISAPLESFYEGGSTRLYRSTYYAGKNYVDTAPIRTSLLRSANSNDYGKSFHDISHAINSSFIRKDFGICVGPGNSQQVILTAELPITKGHGGLIFTSVDSGVIFRSVQLPFHPYQPISFHLHNPDCLLVISTDGGLWLSRDFGNNWSKIHEGVYSFMWGSGITLFLSYSPTNTVEAGQRGELHLRRTQDLGLTFTTIAKNIFSFGYIGEFLFISVMEKPGFRRVIYVSSDQGNEFNKALLPSATTEQFYSVLDGDEDMIFMHVDSPGDETYFGTVYTSDERGILYSKSLERHLFGAVRKSDFTNVTSLRGVYLTNILDEEGQICTVITFNRGGKWRPLKKPKNFDCGTDVKRCNLHIHGEHSHYSGISPMIPLSDPSAVGLIIAHGSVGDSISASKPDVYVSSDGGYSWIFALRGPHHYSILDSGGLIVAVEVHRGRQVNSIKFSTDEGQCWKTYNFTKQPIFFAGLASEPGAKSLNISVFGYRPDDDDQPMWVAVTIDFEQLLTKKCNKQDYVKWLAHSDEEGKVSDTDGCVLGYKETFWRLRKMSVCRNGRDYMISKQQSQCPCTREDYMCDFGYYRHENTSECVKQPDFTDQMLELCVNGELEKLQTTGYRKIPSDKCEGGFSPLRQMDSSKTHCGKSSQASTKSPNSNKTNKMWLQIVIGVSLGTVALAVIAAATITFQRMNHRQRPILYRFSALQIQEDEHSAESVPSSNRASYQEDSDDDLID